jgi:uracil phosphoribosyltransferase
MSSTIIVSIFSIIGLAIIFLAEMVERHYAGFGQRDHEGLAIVKWCVVAVPLLAAALRMMPELAYATPIIFVGKIAITATLRRFA